ncbi:hypothetical protein ACJMK2_004470, partial [Sinanodonta woodiana]
KLIKMKSTFVIIILLCISVASTDGRKCSYSYKSNGCVENMDVMETCSASRGECFNFPGTKECRCVKPNTINNQIN